MIDLGTHSTLMYDAWWSICYIAGSPLFSLLGECELFLILRILILTDAAETDFTVGIYVNSTLGY